MREFIIRWFIPLAMPLALTIPLYLFVIYKFYSDKLTIGLWGTLQGIAIILGLIVFILFLLDSSAITANIKSYIINGYKAKKPYYYYEDPDNSGWVYPYTSNDANRYLKSEILDWVMVGLTFAIPYFTFKYFNKIDERVKAK